MDFRFTPEQEALRKEFQEFFEAEAKLAPPGWAGALEDTYSTDEGWHYHVSTAKKLGEKGWLTLPWPGEYGGQEHSPIEQLIFNEIRGYYRVPGVDVFGIGMLGPTLLEHGNEYHKREFLPPIARGEVMWCQGWSEPNAGSDLASLTTRAVEDGDDYVINGQKIWTTGAHRADWMFMLARTDPDLPRHRGLSYFLLNMKERGVTVRPLKDMAGNHMFNEVFFDEVRVPKRNMVGEKNRGWYVTLSTMNFERSGAGTFAEMQRTIEELVAYCRETKWGGQTLAQNPFVRHQLAQLVIENEVGRQMAYRIAWIQTKGSLAAHEASAAKVYGSELAQRLAYFGCWLLGLYGQLKADSKYARFMGRFENTYQTCLGMNIAAGTSEIQRNIIAWRGLELPRD